LTLNLPGKSDASPKNGKNDPPPEPLGSYSLKVMLAKIKERFS
jgi:hypothetical protein